MRDLVDEIQFLNGNLIDLVHDVDATRIDPVT
jgi:hypothetical protein